MGNIRFTKVKLILLHIATLMLLWLFLSANCQVKQKYVVQVAASKAPMDISQFSAVHDILDSVNVVFSENWYRYFIGTFDDYRSAQQFGAKLLAATRLKNIYIHKIEIGNVEAQQPVSAENKVAAPDSDSVRQVSVETPETENPGLPQAEAERASVKPVPDTKTQSKNQTRNSGHGILGLFFSPERIETIESRLANFMQMHLPARLRPFMIFVVDKSLHDEVFLIFTAVILFLILNVTLVIIVLNVTIRTKKMKAKFTRVYGKMYEEAILAYIFNSIDWDTFLIKLKRKNKKQNRKILISILLNFKTNFKGETEKSISEIYIKLGLHNDSLRRTRSFYNHLKARGIRELINLFPEKAKELVDKLINDPNDYLRSEAQIAYIRLNPGAPFNFFYALERPFTRWTQLSAFNLIRIHQLPVPSFAEFLNFRHTNIRNFSLRMITYFQQLENISEVLKRVDDENEGTRFLAYKAINDLRIYDARPLLKSKFPLESDKNKTIILKAFRNIGMPEDFDFLLEVLKTGNMTMKTEACRSLYFMGAETREKIGEIDRKEVPELDLLIAHVTDPRN